MFQNRGVRTVIVMFLEHPAATRSGRSELFLELKSGGIVILAMAVQFLNASAFSSAGCREAGIFNEVRRVHSPKARAATYFRFGGNTMNCNRVHP